MAPWPVAHQVPLPLEFSRQEYWSRLPFPTPGDLPDPGIEPTSLASPVLAGRFFTTRATVLEPTVEDFPFGLYSIFFPQAYNYPC